MKIHNISKGVVLGVLVVAMAACSSTGKKGGAGGYGEGEGGAGGARAYGAEGGAYGAGSGGYFDGAHCNAPQNVQSYYFDYDSNAVYPQDRSRLQSAAADAASRSGKLRIIGNTDNRGSREYNVALGWRRADAVSSVLEQYGVSRQQITTTSNGAEKPIAHGHTEQDYQCNRRVDIKTGG